MMVSKTKLFKRKGIDTLLYRKGPSPICDEEQLINSKLRYKYAPLGLSEYYSPVEEVQPRNAGSEVLIIYFAKLGQSQAETINVDLNYIETLIKSGADVNCTDGFGQTVLHEVALRWPIEVAQFLFNYNANLNKADNYGRTPLHVAVSVDYPEMVKWLVEKGADIHAVTLNENQTSLHYASKYNSINSLVTLLEMGARINDQDYKERTPLQIAAQTGREESCRLLLQNRAAAGVYDDTGMSCLSHMIERMPGVAFDTLGQFQRTIKAEKLTLYYLSYLEKKGWKMSRKLNNKSHRMVYVREPLEAIVKYQDLTLVMHPVIQRLIKKKTQLYGRRSFIYTFGINLLFTLLWTVSTFTLPRHSLMTTSLTATGLNTSNGTASINLDELEIASTLLVEFYTPYKLNIWRLVLEIFGLLLAVYFFIQTRIQFQIAKKNFNDYKVSRLQELRRDAKYSHPRWPQEKKLIEEEAAVINSENASSLYDVWFIFDVLCYVGLVFLMITRIILVSYRKMDYTYETVLQARYYIFPIVLFVIWLRLMSVFRPFVTLGPFIAILGSVAEETVKFSFLFIEFLIPYACAVWMIFGGPRENFQNLPYSYAEFDGVLFNLLRMTVTDDFPYLELFKNNAPTQGDTAKVNHTAKVVGQIITGTFFAFISITCINIYIGLLSNTFSRAFLNAKATGYLLQAEALINAEKRLTKKDRKLYQRTIATDCSPEVVYEVAIQEDIEGCLQVLAVIGKVGRQIEHIQKYQAELKIKTELADEGAMLLYEHDEFLEDISLTLDNMTK